MGHIAWFTPSVLLQITANFGPEFKYSPSDVYFQPVSFLELVKIVVCVVLYNRQKFNLHVHHVMGRVLELLV